MSDNLFNAELHDADRYNEIQERIVAVVGRHQLEFSESVIEVEERWLRAIARERLFGTPSPASPSFQILP